MVELQDVHKTLGGRTILDGLNLSVVKGETFVIIGQSGTGKSVTFKHIVGLLRPDKGNVIIDGENITQLPVRRLREVRQKFGLLFQSGALLNWLNVAQNVALPLKEHTKLPDDQIQQLVLERLKWVGMEDAAEKMPADLSGGMKKRVGLARALIRDPLIVLYDEPTSGLDPVMSSRINQLVREMQERLGLTSIMVTHDMESAYAVADRIGMLYKGKMLEIGSPDEIRRSSNSVVKQFISGGLDGPIQD